MSAVVVKCNIGDRHDARTSNTHAEMVRSRSALSMLLSTHTVTSNTGVLYCV
jgi:hypothetical protein